jgi:electron-transferring-flavoprotein dehydrogenase
VEVYPGFAAVQLLFEGDTVIGARMGDSGRDREGKPKDNFQPGVDVLAKVTILGEGPRGTLTGQAEKRLKLRKGRQPQVYALGVKELWKASRALLPGLVYHTLGFPLETRQFGGGFAYTMHDNEVHLGMVVGLDHRDPYTDVHRLLQELKTHPFMRALLKGGELISYGAKAIPEGGYYAMPRLFANGLMIVGDSAGFVNSQRLKGIHLAVQSGMMAAETALEALLKNDISADCLSSYSRRFQMSQAKRELWRVRNFRQSFQNGFWKGMLHAGFQFFTGGRGLRDPLPMRVETKQMAGLREFPKKPRPQDFDGKLVFDKLSDLYYSDTYHEEDQPSHLKILDPNICDTLCTREYGNPCQYFCPAGVYEIVRNASAAGPRVNFSNCVHCKGCEIADPYQTILWTPPEGGGGPDWKQM